MAKSKNVILNEKTAKIYAIVGLAFIVISLILLGTSINNFNYAQRVIAEGDAVNATCTRKWSETKKKSHKVIDYYYADATYTYGGNIYSCNRLSVDPYTQVGDDIRVYVLPENPAKYVQPKQKSNWFPMIIAFGATTVVGISMLYTAISSIRHIRKYGNTSLEMISDNNGSINNTHQNYRNQYNPYDTYNNNHW